MQGDKNEKREAKPSVQIPGHQIVTDQQAVPSGQD